MAVLNGHLPDHIMPAGHLPGRGVAHVADLDVEALPHRIGSKLIHDIARTVLRIEGSSALMLWDVTLDDTDSAVAERLRAWAEGVVDRAFPALARAHQQTLHQAQQQAQQHTQQQAQQQAEESV